MRKLNIVSSKYRKIYYLFLLITILTSGCFQQKSELQEMSQNKEFKQINENLHINLLERSYYENENYAFFYNNIYQMFKENLDLYKTAWLLKTKEILQTPFNQNDMHLIKNTYEAKKDTLSSYNSIYDTYLKVLIEQIIYDNFSNESINLHVQRLLNQLDDNSGLFYWESEKEGLEEKLTATALVLEVFQVLNTYPKELAKTENKLQELFMDNNNFTYDLNEAKMNLVSKGIPIILSLNYLEIPLNQLNNKVVEERQEWLQYWLQYFNSLSSTEINNVVVNNEIILNLQKASEYMSVDLQIDSKYLNNFEPLSSTVDFQMIYKMILANEIIKDNSANQAVKENVKNFTVDWIYEGDIQFNLRDNYYGMVTAKKLNMPHNKNKILETLTRYHKDRVNSLEELYFFTLSVNELNSLTKFIESIEELYTQLSNEHTEKDIQTTFYLTSIDYLLNLDGSVDKKLDIIFNVEDISNRLNDHESEKELFYIINSAKNQNINLDIDQLSDAIQKYFSQQVGGYTVKNDVNAVNLYSTFRMVRAKEIYQLPIYEEEQKQVLHFVNNLTGEKGGYFIQLPEDQSDVNNYSDLFTLEGFYYGVYLMQLLNE
ncbi:hypothetical protein [Chengkuizengella marina]|uniref:Uncharacterized protein n=1 Tax=Chengkuizengella marina TaxID=2507566 RepID=A0A6N9Q0G9_9BACL|nr:hypothetical protein [Chengkuizengella marina]NBI27454.1 hypothetical protein [Chengkuizengella marina]